tara:strand:- start:1188 stop:1598 length:411 start_codon:yes stop_codon:yes gene_type:complete
LDKAMNILHMFLKLLSLAPFEHARQHWVSQRITSIAIVILGFWFVYQLLFVLTSFDHPEVFAWASDPLNAIILLLLSLYAIYHAELGVQTVIEDYVATKRLRTYTLYLLRFLRVMVVVISFVAIGCIIKGGGASPV